nr:RNA-directed DNA polymerase, eukaryota, reverse transcriptase zinc-binding domain protein [Tanacetum cinerariifolium]
MFRATAGSGGGVPLTSSSSITTQSPNPVDHRAAARAFQFHPARPAIIDLFNLYLGTSGREKAVPEPPWNIRGLSTSDKQNEVRNFISNEELSVCVVLETHIKQKRLNMIGDSIFGRWDWCSNMQLCDNGCRIILCWNNEKVNMSIVHCAKQSVFCEIHTISGNHSMFCTFVYAANGGKERKELWNDMHIHKRIVGNNAWVILGYMNVTLNPNEHSSGSSTMSSDMNDFKDCINNIEVEDIVSSGLFFTWTKNLFKVKAGDATGVLKKLDMIMVNEDFLDKYP